MELKGIVYWTGKEWKSLRLPKTDSVKITTGTGHIIEVCTEPDIKYVCVHKDKEGNREAMIYLRK